MATAYGAYVPGNRAISWLHHVLEELKWLHGVSKRLREYPDPQDDSSRWERRVLQSLPAWKRLLKEAL